MNSYKIINACECSIRYKDNVCLQFRSELNKHYPNYYSFPGGSLDENEDPISAVKREVLEETGIDLKNENLQLSVIEFNYHDDDKELWVIYTFKVTLPLLPTITTSSEGDVQFHNVDYAKSLNLVPQTKNYFDHTQRETKEILVINQHFTDDEITDIVANTIV